MVGGAALAAAFALAGCAPAGYNSTGYGAGTQPAANAVDPSPSASADGAGAAQQPKPGVLTADQTTDELNAATVKRMGQTVQNENGFVLYCKGQCATIWPPALTNNGKPKLSGVDPKVVGTVTRDDGTKQLTIKGWPVYTYIGDKVAGTWKSQNIAGKWFVIKPDGTKNLTCLPAISKPVAPPSDGSSAGSDAGSAGGNYSY
jgi:predicted lipoprotein with Yx(FWY)xxD motif